MQERADERPVLCDGRLLGVIERKAVLRWLSMHRSHDRSPIAAPKFLQRAETLAALAVER